VRLDGRLAEVELAGDLAVRPSAGEELEHLALAGGELRERRRRVRPGSRPADVVLDQAPDDLGREQRVAGGDGAHGGGELARRRALEQEAAGARAERLIDVLVVVERGEHEDACADAGVGLEPSRGLDPVDARHPDVHEHDVGRCAQRRLERLGAVRGLADHRDVVLALEDRPEPAPHQRLVVGEQDPDHGAASTGRRARTRNPPSGPGPASSSPL
jgi:hypothetical protein